MNKFTDLVGPLVRTCSEAARRGIPFPDIWNSILKHHSMVAGPPIQTFDDEQPHLEVKLRNGFWLRYCARSNDFSLRRAVLHRCF